MPFVVALLLGLLPMGAPSAFAGNVKLSDGKYHSKWFNRGKKENICVTLVVRHGRPVNWMAVFCRDGTRFFSTRKLSLRGNVMRVKGARFHIGSASARGIQGKLYLKKGSRQMSFSR